MGPIVGKQYSNSETQLRLITLDTPSQLFVIVSCGIDLANLKLKLI